MILVIQFVEVNRKGGRKVLIIISQVFRPFASMKVFTSLLQNH
jgi:hypothetical protein